MRLTSSISLVVLLVAGLASAETPSKNELNVEARAKIANVLEQRWYEPHKTHHHYQPPPTPSPIQNKPKHQPGQSCHDDHQCQSGKCNKWKCVSKPYHAKPYQFCNGGRQCESGYYCSTTKDSCQPVKKAGGSCKTGDSCASNICFRQTCINKHSISTGKSCGGDDQCQTGFCSYLENWKCRTTFPKHHACSRDSVCSSGRCHRSKCT